MDKSATIEKWLLEGPLWIPGVCDLVVEYARGMTGTCVQNFGTHSPRTVTGLLVMHDGMLVSTSMSLIHVWHLSDGECLHTLTGHSDFVRCVGLLPDGKLVSGSSDQTVRVWDITEGRCVHTLAGHVDTVWALALPNGRIASASLDGTVRVWDVESGLTLMRLVGHSWYVVALAVLEDDERLASGSWDTRKSVV